MGDQDGDTLAVVRHNFIAYGYSEMYRGALDWDDARLFLAVAREGSLRSAARKLGISQPTVGRRLARFETSASAVPLFDRFPEGLRLTDAGKSVLPLAERLEAAALALQGQRATPGPQPSSVRISVGEWAGDFLAQCLGEPDRQRLPDGVALELVASDQTVNLTRREADLAVRHGRPETGDLYVSRVGTIACAAYAVPGTKADTAAWITYAQEQAHYALSRWISATIAAKDAPVSTRASSMSMQAAAARTGAGVAISALLSRRSRSRAGACARTDRAARCAALADRAPGPAPASGHPGCHGLGRPCVCCEPVQIGGRRSRHPAVTG